MTRIIGAAGLILLILAPARIAAAPSNSIRITESAGVAQSGRAFTISRFFARSEIAQYAQARVGGAPVQTQCDVKTRWDDGSVQHAMLSFRSDLSANSTIVVDFVSQATGNNTGYLDAAGMLDTANFDFGAQIEISAEATQSANARTMLEAGKFRYWLKGPICTQVILEDASSALSFDMGWDSNRSLHPVFVATFYPGMRSVKIEAILENFWTTKLQDQQYALTIRAGQPLRPTPVFTKPNFSHVGMTRWRRTFWTGAEPGKLRVDYNLPYMVYSKALPNYDTSRQLTTAGICQELYGNTGCTAPGSDVAYYPALSAGGFDIMGNYALSGGFGGQYIKSMGTAGGRGDIGYLPRWHVRYLYSMSSTLPHAPDLYDAMLANGEVSGNVPVHLRESAGGRLFDGRSVDAFGKILSIDARPTVRTIDITNKQFGNTNANDRLGIVNLQNVIDATNTAPIVITTAAPHGLQTGNTVRVFQVGGNWAADGDWTVTVTSPNTFALNGSTGNGAYTSGGNVWTVSRNGWGPEMNHEPSMVYVPYLITGDWYLLEELYNWASWGLALGLPANCWDCRGGNGSWGRIGVGELRGQAWGIRDLSHAALMAPDGTPEKAYFLEKLDNNLAIREGQFNITDGAYYSSCTTSPYSSASETSKWCWGRNTMPKYDPNPLYFFEGNPGLIENLNPSVTSAGISPWQANYFHIVLGHLAEWYPKARKLQQTMAKNLLNQLTNPQYNPYLADVYRMGTVSATTGRMFTSWAEVKSAFPQSGNSDFGAAYFVANKTSFEQANDEDVEHGYSHIAQAAASYLPGLNDGVLDGNAAWNFMVGAVRYQNLLNDNPKWALIPRSAPASTPASACDLNGDGLVNVLDVALGLNQIIGSVPCGTADLDRNGRCDILDLQRLVNAAMTGTCRVGP